MDCEYPLDQRWEIGQLGTCCTVSVHGRDDEKNIFDEDDEIDTFADAGLDYDELEFMDPDERREVLEDAGLDPDEFDF